MTDILIPTPLRKFTKNESRLSLQGENVLELIQNLVQSYPELEPYLLDDDTIKPYIKLFLGDTDIESLEQEQTKLSEGDVLSIIPAIAGGIQEDKS